MVGAARSGKKAEVRVKAELTATVPALKSILTFSVLRLSMVPIASKTQLDPERLCPEHPEARHRKAAGRAAGRAGHSACQSDHGLL